LEENNMSENMDTNYDDFFGAYDGDDGYQTGAAEETTEETVTDTSEVEEEEQYSEVEEGSESGETNDNVNDHEAEEVAAEGKQEDEKPVSEQKFVVKVNKETREVSYQDAPAWIQKGMDYDRVKGQLESEQKHGNELQTKLDEQKPIMDVLELAAEDSGMSITELVEHVHLSMMMGKGMTEKEAKAELRALKAEKQVKNNAEKSAPAKEVPAEPAEDNRAQREVQEFMRNFPGVTLTDEQIQKMKPYIHEGKSMTAAYLMMENARLQAEAAQQKQKDAAAAQSKKNRSKAPVSQRDSGGQRAKSAEDDFFAAFEK
jgi:hypothetical protein